MHGISSDVYKEHKHRDMMFVIGAWQGVRFKCTRIVVEATKPFKCSGMKETFAWGDNLVARLQVGHWKVGWVENNESLVSCGRIPVEEGIN